MHAACSNVKNSIGAFPAICAMSLLQKTRKVVTVQ